MRTSVAEADFYAPRFTPFADDSSRRAYLQPACRLGGTLTGQRSRRVCFRLQERFSVAATCQPFLQPLLVIRRLPPLLIRHAGADEIDVGAKVAAVRALALARTVG